MSRVKTNWAGERKNRVGQGPKTAAPMRTANADMIERVADGAGPNKLARDPALGARAVANIPAVHVPAFCKEGYKNAYDLEAEQRIRLGNKAPTPSPLRKLVDDVLSKIVAVEGKKIYFLAVEVNGTGIRFYGDICLVLAKGRIAANAVVLTCNSYDLARAPLMPPGASPSQAVMTDAARTIWGRWKRDLANMCVLKVFDLRPDALRRFTTGQVSETILQDEDYLEVLRVGAFKTSALQEARVSVADAALETRIGEQLRGGPCPNLAELQWRKHRKAALKALGEAGIATRVVTTAGRVRA